MISTLSLMENAETESEVLSIGISVIMLKPWNVSWTSSHSCNWN